MSLYNLSLVSKKTVSHPSPAEIQEIHATNMHHFDDTRCPTTRSRFIKPSHLPTNIYIYIYTHDKPLFYKFYTYIHIFTIKILWLQANLAGCYGQAQLTVDVDAQPAAQVQATHGRRTGRTGEYEELQIRSAGAFGQKIRKQFL